MEAYYGSSTQTTFRVSQIKARPIVNEIQVGSPTPVWRALVAEAGQQFGQAPLLSM